MKYSEQYTTNKHKYEDTYLFYHQRQTVFPSKQFTKRQVNYFLILRPNNNSEKTHPNQSIVPARESFGKSIFLKQDIMITLKRNNSYEPLRGQPENPPVEV